ncbi:MAG TPA: DUF4232 domain-containing protein [Candidatus Dormibacteraeota bacterium]|nr:DUF4232 domain-containing protein [Candidatus Dormibacteraeota bacterium]
MAIVVTVALAACGGSTPPVAAGSPTPPAASATPPAPSPTVAPRPGVERCHVGALSIARTAGDAASGGLRVDTFLVTNTGQSACSLYGYVGMLMLGLAGQAMPTNVVRRGGDVAGGDPGPSLLVLQPHTTAMFLAGWRAWEGAGTTCAAASMLQITPPDEYDHLTIPVTWGLAPCRGGEIDVTAVHLPGDRA